jgi:hypothetical protein
VTAPTKSPSKVRHEEFCLPRPGAQEPRMEAFPYYSDDPGTGRSRVTHRVDRCLECGAATYTPIGA